MGAGRVAVGERHQAVEPRQRLELAAARRAVPHDLRQRRAKRGRGAFVPLAFLPGEAFQFDWSEDWATIGRDRTKSQVAHFKLCYKPRLHSQGLSAANPALSSTDAERDCLRGDKR